METGSTPSSLSFKGQATKQTTVTVNGLLLVIVLTKAAPALFIKWRGEYFLK